MLLIIKKGLFAWYVLDQNKKTVATIRSRRFFGLEKSIADSGGRAVYTTDAGTEPGTGERIYRLREKEKTLVTAWLIPEKTPEKAQVPPFPLPRAAGLRLETPYGLWSLKRERGNEIVICQNERQIGAISPFNRLGKQRLELCGSYGAAFAAGLYVLADYMTHEDDVMAV